jgi:hypothetical protein
MDALKVTQERDAELKKLEEARAQHIKDSNFLQHQLQVLEGRRRKVES